jgi:hypothetical protein
MSSHTVARFAVAAAVIGLAATHQPARAANTQVPGKLIIIKSGKLAKFIAKPTSAPFPTPTPGGSADPTAVDASFSIVDEADNARALFVNLPKAQWKGLGNPDGDTGYKYNGAGTVDDPCKVVLVKGTVIKAVCRDDQFLDPPLVGDPAVKLRLGTDSYAARFAGTMVKNQLGLYKASSAPECTPPLTCCGGQGFHAFTTGNAGGTCGSLTDLFGNPPSFPGGPLPDLACSGLYFGGGQNGVPLPLTFPSQEQTITAITSCSGQTATLGATTSTDTGSNRNCSAAGCLFGPPVPLPNASTTPVSVCVLFSVQGTVAGTLDCGTGAQSLDLPLNSQVYLTGDSSTDPGSSIPGIQSCPICSAGSCIGGPNNGMACTPSSTSGSTTHDCPPEPTTDIGPVPLAFDLSSGTVSWTGTPATNDTGSTASGQSRVFSGYCRDLALPGGTGGFDADAVVGFQFKQCWENGMAVGTPCSEANNGAESCEQRDHGAFGPAGGAILTITAFGQPQDGILCAPSAGVLATLFSIAPTFEPTVDAAANFPGPAAVGIPVVGALCSTASTCPLSGS